MNQAYQKLLTVITENAIPFSLGSDSASDTYSTTHNYAALTQSLLDDIGESRFVLIGEASHGTQEFYQARIAITQQLLLQKNFMAVAIEGDWPDAYGIHRYIQEPPHAPMSSAASLRYSQGPARHAESALSQFKRFPTWMWRNETLPPFLDWLQDHNHQRLKSNSSTVGFYGLDLYSLHRSMQAVIDYLATIDPEAAQHAQARYACFDDNSVDPQNYGYLIHSGLKKSCAKEAVAQFLEIQCHALEYEKKNSPLNDEYFFATQNARLVKNAEYYYRAMFDDHVSTWNIRDQHMAETLNVLADHLENKYQTPAKIIVWAHNSHIGDARATEAAERSEINIGQLVREQHDRDVYLIGFSTHSGSVTAANNWGDAANCMRVNPALKGSYEELFHQIEHDNFLLILRDNAELQHYLNTSRLQRAIGVIYRPDTERQSHYFFTRLPYQFDAMIHLDQTQAVKPLDFNPEWKITTG